MATATTLPPDEPPTILYVGQHESERKEPVTSAYLAKAQDMGYDILTTRITTQAFQSRIVSNLEDHVSRLTASNSPNDLPLPIISPLTPQDTDVDPNDANSSLVAIASPWIDLGSSDPLIAHISRQVLSLEVAHAAFCGISNVLVHGPTTSAGTVPFARALLEALGAGPYLQLHVLLPMNGELEQDASADGMHLSQLARPQYAQDLDDAENELDSYVTWEAWNTIRVVCQYSNKLSIGTHVHRPLSQLLPLSFSCFPVRLVQC